MPNWGGGASGALSGAGAGAAYGSFVPGIGTGIGAGVGAIAGGLMGLFKKKANAAPAAATNGALDPYTSALQQNATGAQAQGQQAVGQGMDAISPVMKYLQSILSGDPQAMLAATQPERGRVIDQYDTARRSAEEFGPRGGGTTSSLAGSRFQQAQSLGDITSSTRSNAAASEGQLGAQLAQIGLSSEQLATMDLNDVMQAALGKSGQDITKRGQNMQAWEGVGQAAGSLLGAYLTKGKAA